MSQHRRISCAFGTLKAAAGRPASKLTDGLASCLYTAGNGQQAIFHTSVHTYNDFLYDNSSSTSNTTTFSLQVPATAGLVRNRVIKTRRGYWRIRHFQAADLLAVADLQVSSVQDC